MDPLTIGVVAMTCSIIIAATNLTMCTLQSCTAVKKSYEEHSSEASHTLSDDHHNPEHDSVHLVDLVGKAVHPE